VAGADSPWARRRKLTLADLKEAVWTLPPLDSLLGSVIVETFRAGGLEVPPVTVFTSITAARDALVATGRFVSIVHDSAMRFGAPHPALKILPVALPPTHRQIGAVTLKTRTLSPAARLFIDCAHEFAASIAQRRRR
jgi:DNA-binding transcriptional LysR family regulator